MTTAETADRIKQMPFVTSIEKILDEPDYGDDYLFADFSGWNTDNMGPIYLPKKRDKIQGEDLKKYMLTIHEHEGVDVAGFSEYEFQKSYCFVLGDNRYDAVDSRYIGLVPMDKVLGPVTSIIEPK